MHFLFQWSLCTLHHRHPPSLPLPLPSQHGSVVAPVHCQTCDDLHAFSSCWCFQHSYWGSLVTNGRIATPCVWDPRNPIVFPLPPPLLVFLCHMFIPPPFILKPAQHDAGFHSSKQLCGGAFFPTGPSLAFTCSHSPSWRLRHPCCHQRTGPFGVWRPFCVMPVSAGTSFIFHMIRTTGDSIVISPSAHCELPLHSPVFPLPVHGSALCAFFFSYACQSSPLSSLVIH